MEGVLHQDREDHKTVLSHINPSLLGLKKYTYVLPSGRIMKVVVYDEKEMTSSTS
ncbi:MAG: hypothetical protein JSW38_12140 [Dehalococcoidia bacterium]|nr:MAG: hypothetical protein JSW38_12140 [Dehalococcoidia bacterium]